MKTHKHCSFLSPESTFVTKFDARIYALFLKIFKWLKSRNHLLDVCRNVMEPRKKIHPNELDAMLDAMCLSSS